MSKITFQPMVIPTGAKTPTMTSRELFAGEGVNGAGSLSSSYSSQRSGIYRGASVEVSPLASSVTSSSGVPPPLFDTSSNEFGFFTDMDARFPIVHAL
jgi:hypothetical protein